MRITTKQCNMEDKIEHKIAEILDRYLPAEGAGTEREVLRQDLHREIIKTIKEKSFVNDAKISRKHLPDGKEWDSCEDVVESVNSWVYELGLRLDNIIPTYGHDNWERIEIAVKTLIKIKE